MEQTEQSVWARVTERHDDPEQLLLPERLSILTIEEKTSADAYRQLAARLSGADGAAVRRLHAQTENRVRRLNVLYFLISGLRPNLKGEHVPFHADRCEALREQYLSAHAQQSRYRKTALEFPAYAGELNGFASELQHDLQTLSQILQHCM